MEFEHLIQSGIYRDKDVWRFYSVDEIIKHQSEAEVPNYVIEDFKKFIGKTWVGRGKEYKIIGFEDNNAYCDYYWILEDESHNRIYELWSSEEFYKTIKMDENNETNI